LRTIAHISDLHFGRVDCAILPALAAAITAAEPDLVAISGDLTQRARAAEFLAARRFLDQLPKPQIVVPGNHDVPLYNLWARWRTPLAKYRRYINGELAPFFSDDEIAVLGINTARSLTIKDGRINQRQVAMSCKRMAELNSEGTRILVTHHPFDVAEPSRTRDVVGRAAMAMAEFARCRIDVILTGHLHLTRMGTSQRRYNIPGYGALFIQAGTATSVRQRGEQNAWNLIRVEKDNINVECLGWRPNEKRFLLLKTERFRRGADGWCQLGVTN
jgi:3',5'-cyclic AMP phosphodiesterase CpdA